MEQVLVLDFARFRCGKILGADVRILDDLLLAVRMMVRMMLVLVRPTAARVPHRAAAAAAAASAATVVVVVVVVLVLVLTAATAAIRRRRRGVRRTIDVMVFTTTAAPAVVVVVDVVSSVARSSAMVALGLVVELTMVMVLRGAAAVAVCRTDIGSVHAVRCGARRYPPETRSAAKMARVQVN